MPTDRSVTEVRQQKEVFGRIRNYLAGRLVGTSRDEALLHEVLKCMFCRVRINGSLPTRVGPEVDPIEIAKRYRAEFRSLRVQLDTLFEKDEELLMDPTSLSYVHEELSTLNLRDPNRDPVADLYETFVGSAIRAADGQFFTPLNAVQWLVDAIDPKPGELIVDPACGAGSFLSGAARSLLRKGSTPADVAACLFGVEKDSYLTRLAHAHLALSLQQTPTVLCGDSLAWTNEVGETLPTSWRSRFDVVLTNPPFGTRIVSASDAVRGTFALAHRWKTDETGRSVRQGTLQSSSPPQVLFIERCLSLLRPGGRLGAVVPESLISSAGYSYVVDFLRDQADIEAVVGMPESLFKTSGKGGTHTKTALIVARRKDDDARRSASTKRIFMAEAQWCGHDSRGREIERDDLPTILDRYLHPSSNSDSLGYWIELNAKARTTLAPRYHNPGPTNTLDKLAATHELVRIGDLVSQGVLHFSTGDEVGKLAYGGSDVPFIRTSDLSNWEVKIDPKHTVSEAVYSALRTKQDVQEGDILFVKDGTYLIGNCAYVSAFDTKIVFQSHLYKIRSTDHEQMSPFLLLALLSCEPVLAQIKAKRMTHDIIDSLGDRVYELMLPVPRSHEQRSRIIRMVQSSINDRIEARELARAAKRAVIDATADIATNGRPDLGRQRPVSDRPRRGRPAHQAG